MEKTFWLELSVIEHNALHYANIYMGIYEHLNQDDGSFAEFKDIDEMALWFYKNVFTGTDICELKDILESLMGDYK